MPKASPAADHSPTGSAKAVAPSLKRYQVCILYKNSSSPSSPSSATGLPSVQKAQAGEWFLCRKQPELGLTPTALGPLEMVRALARASCCRSRVNDLVFAFSL